MILIELIIELIAGLARLWATRFVIVGGVTALMIAVVIGLAWAYAAFHQ